MRVYSIERATGKTRQLRGPVALDSLDAQAFDVGLVVTSRKGANLAQWAWRLGYFATRGGVIRQLQEVPNA